MTDHSPPVDPDQPVVGKTPGEPAPGEHAVREPAPGQIEHVAGVDYEHVGRAYLEERKLSRAAGVALIWGLGVGYVISGARTAPPAVS
jgi:hypothetical protein